MRRLSRPKKSQNQAADEKKDRNQRKEHVGRFFLQLMEKNLRQCLRDSFISTAGNLLQPTPGIHVLASHFISPGHYSFGGKVKVLERFYERLVKLGDVINFDEAINRINSRDLPIAKPLKLIIKNKIVPFNGVMC